MRGGGGTGLLKYHTEKSILLVSGGDVIDTAHLSVGGRYPAQRYFISAGLAVARGGDHTVQ